MSKLIAALAALTAGIETAASVYNQIQSSQLLVNKERLLGAETGQKPRIGFSRTDVVH